MSAPNDSETENNSLRIPACDACRTRKIRCDRKSPCSSCKSSGIECRNTKKKPEKRQRVHISSRYEDEITAVNQKLETLTQTLQKLVSNPDRHSPSYSYPASIQGQEVFVAPKDDDNTETEIPWEGDSSFNTHSKHVTQAFERAIGVSPSTSIKDDSSPAVSTIHRFLSTIQPEKPPSNSISGTRDSLDQYPELTHLSLPPVQTILRLLRIAKVHPQKFFVDYPLIDLGEFTTLCQKLYFPTEEFTIAIFISVHAGVLFVLRDMSEEKIKEYGFDPAEVTRCCSICSTNLETATKIFRLSIESTLDNIRAIILSAVFAMEYGRTFTAWKLIAAASRMCQDGGFHRLPEDNNDPDLERKRMTFWFVYVLDHGMALNFGRAPNIQDYDISVGRPKATKGIDPMMCNLVTTWIEFAETQGQVYEQLYSARAQREPTSVKAERAPVLAKSILNIKEKITTFDFISDLVPVDLLDAVRYTDIMCYSVLTLIYRMVPPSQPTHPLQFNDQCVAYGRAALQAVNQAYSVMSERKSDWMMFVHNTVLFCPFTPYIVVFGNVIAYRNRDDLMLLEKMAHTLEGTVQLSSGVSKLYQVCLRFYQIAKAYLEHFESTASLIGAGSGMTDLMMANTLPQAGETLEEMDFQQDWDGLLDEWDLGLGAENAREMSSYFEQYLAGNQNVVG